MAPSVNPIQLGKDVTLETPVILAPMSGVTDLPFRRLVKKSGAPLVVSEMIASEAVVRQNKRTMMMASHTPEEFPMSVQLAGCEPHIMAEAAKMNEDNGAQIIDINFGCPAKKVVNGYAGSALMRDEILAGKILEETVKAVNIPVTLKMRKGWDANTQNAPTLARIAKESGIQMLTVHGRTRCDFYRGSADWEFIRTVKEATDLPLIANGDIIDYDDVLKALKLSGANGVMIGRGCYGKPWLINDVVHFLKTGERRNAPSIDIIYAMILEHYEETLSHYGRQTGVKLMRKHLGWYSKGLEGGSEFRAAVNRLHEENDVKEALKRFFEPKIDGTTQNPAPLIS